MSTKKSLLDQVKARNAALRANSESALASACGDAAVPRAQGDAEGGASPRPVKRGESPHGAQRGAIVDWLRFTFLPLGQFSHALEQLDRYFKLWFSIPVTLVHSKRGGMHGYEVSYDVMSFVDGEMIRVGIVACGGAHVGGTMLVDLSGTGCAIVNDWQSVFATMQDLDAKITRCDLAVDFIEGEVSIEQIKEMYFDGQFNSGGRIPKYYLHEGGDIHSRGCLGRTFEIGKRMSGKLLRAYEKGKQLGDQESEWLRIEIELHNKNREIPHDIVLRRNEYFKGAHKALEPLIHGATEKVKTLQRQASIELESKLDHLNTQYGKTIYQAQQVYTPADLVKRVTVIGAPRSMGKVVVARHVYGAHEPAPIYGSDANGNASKSNDSWRETVSR